MAINKCIGIDIGSYRVKICVINRGRVVDFFAEPIPENMVQNGEVRAWNALGQYLREILKKHGVRIRTCFISVPLQAHYLRMLTLPLMTVPLLEMNLPYEFHDYISEDSEEYYYDYSMISRSEKTMRLQAAAMSKAMIAHYNDMAKSARLKLRGLIPEPLSYQRILRHYEEKAQHEGQKDYAILDMGEQGLRIHFFSKGYYETTRTMEGGGKTYIQRVAELLGCDPHMARIRYEANQEEVQEREELQQMRDADAVQVMRVLNFYSFNNPHNTIDSLYVCGGGVEADAMLLSLSERLSLPVRLLSDLFTDAEDSQRLSILDGPQAYGITVPLDQAEVEILTEGEEEEASGE